MAIGFLRGASDLQIRDVGQLGNVGYPHYDTPRVMATARQAFALLSVICLAMTGLSAWLVCRRPATILLAPVMLLASPLFFRHSWTYLNVDIVGATFVMLTVAACLLGTTRPSFTQSALIPGIFAGLAAASKYTLAIAVLPVLVAIGLYLHRRVISACALAIAAMLLAFLVGVPYSLVDIPGFLNGVGYEVFHYASGHAGFAGEPGLEQAVYYVRHFLSEFGYGAVALAVIGLVRLSRTDWRRAAVVTIFPAALFWLLTSQRVHFTRNALPIHPFVAMFAAYGFASVHDWLVQSLARRGWALKRVSAPVLAGVVLFGATVPFWHFGPYLRGITDSRNEARAWIAGNLPSDWMIVVPRELGFDLRGLEARGRRVKVVDLRPARDPETVNSLLSDVTAPAVIIVPRWGADRRSPGQEAADALSTVARQWRVIKTFGHNDVLVNYLYPTAWGDPAFAIAVLK
jgi:hypothetical protein